MTTSSSGSKRIWTVLIVLTLILIALPMLARAFQGNEYEQAEAAYKAAQRELDRDHYKLAAQQFAEIAERYKQTDYAADALYWQAFALYRLGGKAELRQAVRALEHQAEFYEQQARTLDDAEILMYRLYGKLAEQGDSEASEWVIEHANPAEDTEANHTKLHSQPHDLDTKLAALHALMNMNPDRAVPLLKKVLANRDPGYAELREQAIFLLGQSGDDEAVSILMDLAQTDPDDDVQEQAIFWLG
ncbi:MAG: HEAT repeat domain-containing protein, partial [bacterium]